MHRLVLLCSFILLASGCVTPRSAVFGRTPAAVGAGAMEMALSPGVLLHVVNAAPTPVGAGDTDTLSTRTLSAPAFEGNAEYGLTDWLGLNVHLSPAGLQPGLKVTLPAFGERVRLAILPELAFGAGSQGSGVSQVRPTGTNVVDRGGRAVFLLQGGFKVLLAHDSGVYGGLGYDYQRLSTEVLNGGASQQGSVATSHGIGLAVGYELKVGLLTLRPELALGFVPAANTWNTVGASTTYVGGGSEVLLFPNLTVVLGSASGPPPTPAPEGLRPEDLSLPPLFPAP